MRVRVHITGTQCADGERETIRQQSEGHLTVRDGQFVLAYAEPDDEGHTTPATLCATADEVRLERGEGVRSLLVLKRGQRCTCDYLTPYGSFPMEVTTHRLQNDLTPDGGELFMEYTLAVGGGLSRNTVHIVLEKY